jgi:hypothetical protein
MLLPTSRNGTWRILSLAFGVLGAFTSAAPAGFIPISQPDATYLSETTLLPITAADFDVVSSLSAGNLAVTFNTGLVALTVPTTWSSWGSRPDVESSKPRVLWTNGSTSLTITLNRAVQIFGVEAQPNTSVVSSILASFYSGANLIGEIPLDVDGDAGARLFAASSTASFDTIVLSSTDDFAIAQVRLSASVPEPSSLILLFLGLVVVSARLRCRAIPVPGWMA